MNKIGIIANPASGKDIRRVVSGARVVSHQEKANIIARLLCAVEACGLHEIHVMPDASGLSRKIAQVAQTGRLHINVVDLPFITGTWRDTLAAVEAMVAAGCRVIVTLGGDGTNRIVAKASRNIPLIPISTGTNNVFPTMIEGTVAGMAAAAIVSRDVDLQRCCIRAPMLEIVDAAGSIIDTALVDIAVVKASSIAARAVWETQTIDSVFVTAARADAVGLSAIAGVIAKQGLPTHVRLGKGGASYLVVIAPGYVKSVPIEAVESLAERKPVRIAAPGAMLALDGERELRIPLDACWSVRFTTQGPVVVDIAKTLAFARQKNGLRRTGGEKRHAA